MDIKFNVKVNKKRRYIVNGKEYDSLEAMPENIRAAFEAALAARDGKKLSAGGTGLSVEQRIADEEARVESMAQGFVSPGGVPKSLIAAAILAILLILIYYLTHR